MKCPAGKKTEAVSCGHEGGCARWGWRVMRGKRWQGMLVCGCGSGVCGCGAFAPSEMRGSRRSVSQRRERRDTPAHTTGVNLDEFPQLKVHVIDDL